MKDLAIILEQGEDHITPFKSGRFHEVVISKGLLYRFPIDFIFFRSKTTAFADMTEPGRPKCENVLEVGIKTLQAQRTEPILYAGRHCILAQRPALSATP